METDRRSATDAAGPRQGGETTAVATASSGHRRGRAEFGMPAQDWDLLLAVVAERLRRCDDPMPASDMRHDLHLCAHALKLLQTALHGERDRVCRVEAELLDAMTQLAATRQELHHTRASELDALQQSQFDSLTELPNRRHFHRRLEDALRAGPAQPLTLAVLYVDLDDFKPINDQHGHATGDSLLRIVAQRLHQTMSAGDVVCRLGGDEFACLLPRPLQRAELGALASRLVEAVAAPVMVGRHALHVRPSIGIAVYPADGASTASLLQRADAAMYHAKRRNQGYAFAGDAPAAEPAEASRLQ